jgi:putative DNA methylase
MVPVADDKRLIEDYLPIREISAEASREKSVRKGHISTLHLWWARRPLVACRAAVYGALVPATQFQPVNGPEEKRASLGRANAQKFITRLCKYPGDPEVIKQAQRHILEAHAARLTAEDAEIAKKEGREPRVITAEDIEAGRAPRPKALDIFAGGGSIPLEALRLGCEAYALELNPVAHIIELCTLVYPQKYGRPDPTVPGMTGPPMTHRKDAEDAEESSLRSSRLCGEDRVQRSWGGLAKEVEYWGRRVLEQVRCEIGDLYPPIPDPDYKGKRPEIEFDRETGYWVEKGAKAVERESVERGAEQASLTGLRGASRSHAPAPPRGYLTPVAYLWTRTVKCKNPNCERSVPLLRRMWLSEKRGNYCALRAVADHSLGRVRYTVVRSASAASPERFKPLEVWGFDPELGSSRGHVPCPFCGTVADLEYVRNEGKARRLARQLVGVVCARYGSQAKVYFGADDLSLETSPQDATFVGLVDQLCSEHGLTPPDELVTTPCHEVDRLPMYGMTRWRDAFTPRQLLMLLTFAKWIRSSEAAMVKQGISRDAVQSVATYLALTHTTLAHYNSALSLWLLEHMISVFIQGQAIPMRWDFAEANPFGSLVGTWQQAVFTRVEALESLSIVDRSPMVSRGSASQLPYGNESVDCVITDPPYYDNIGYANLSDFFYVWLRRTVGHLYPEHFAAAGTPKKAEIVSDPSRHSGSMDAARQAYELMMTEAFREGARVLRPQGALVTIYAHKTSAGWASLVNALRTGGFVVVQAWPVEMERSARLLAYGTAALSSNVFLVARKRDGAAAGSYEQEVRPELESIVRERVDTLWKMGISGADLVIAAVGAGLRAYTQFERVAYENGEEVPAERFLSEVEGVVLDTVLEKIFGLPAASAAQAGVSRSGVSAVDAPTRFYVLWRFTYRQAEIDAGEAIVFAYPQHVELDGPRSLTYGARALLEKKKSKYRLRDFTERGDDEKLGLPTEDGTAAPLIDVLHRVLWLMENRPAQLYEFLGQAVPDTERLRLVAQALAGPALEGGEDLGMARNPEQAALRKLTTNWRSLIEESTLFRRRE